MYLPRSQTEQLYQLNQNIFVYIFKWNKAKYTSLWLKINMFLKCI